MSGLNPPLSQAKGSKLSLNALTWLETHRWDAIALSLVGLLGLATGLWAHQIVLDDAMITYRVAENLAYGRGFVFNPGERVQVTTTPLYAIVLAAGTWLLGTAPQAALGLNLALAALIPALTFDVGRRLAGRMAGLVASILIPFLPLLVIAFSMESYLYVALILASLNAYIAQRYRLAGVVIGLAAMTRGDGALVGACILTYDTLVRRRLVWSMILPGIGLPLLWYLFATGYYGSPWPATLSAKAAQGRFDWLGYHFLDGLWEYWDDWAKDYSYWLYVLPTVMLAGLISCFRLERSWLIVVAHATLYVTTFAGLGVAFAEWYYAPLMPAVALLTGCGVQTVASMFSNQPTASSESDQTVTVGRGLTRMFGIFSYPRKPAKTRVPRYSALSFFIAAALTLFLLYQLYPITRDIVAANPDWKARVYPAAGRWIAANTSAAANLGIIDIGHLGYWSGRPIIDIVGLAQPDVPPHIAEGDFGYALRHYRPDMVLLGALWLPEIQSEPWFQADYVPRYALKFSRLDQPLVLFTRRDGVKVQLDKVPAAELQPLAIDFNGQVRLNAYHHNSLVEPGQSLHLTLHWQATAPIEQDYTVFVQLVDAQDTILSQGDSKPQQGFYRTVFWQPGEQIIDSYTLPVPADIAAGRYDLLIGFYQADSGARLPVTATGTDYVRLPGVVIEE